MNEPVDEKNEQRKNIETLDRIDGKYILREISSIINFDKGIFYTIRELILRPGNTVREFLLYDRKRIIKPMIFLIICSLVYTISQQIFHFEDGYMNSGGFEDSAVTNVFNWIQKKLWVC